MWINRGSNLKYWALDSIVTYRNWKKAKDSRLFVVNVRIKWTIKIETQSIVEWRKVNLV